MSITHGDLSRFRRKTQKPVASTVVGGQPSPAVPGPQARALGGSEIIAQALRRASLDGTAEDGCPHTRKACDQ